MLVLDDETEVGIWKAPSKAGSEMHIHLGPDVIEGFRARLQEEISGLEHNDG